VLFSTFLMWLLAELYEELPEVGDVERPKLVFFFDEAHLLFKDASKPFLTALTQTVRLIRSIGVAVFFVTQTPKDVHADVLAQLGSRVQHQLRAFTPDDEKALRATARTFPKSAYDLEELLTTLGIGEAAVTVQSEKGTPTPVAATMIRAPLSLMAPTPADQLQQILRSSPLYGTYATAVDRASAREMLGGQVGWSGCFGRCGSWTRGARPRAAAATSATVARTVCLVARPSYADTSAGAVRR
jgi:DNA double-strand break repair helicase HerA and related ATPase